MYVTILVNTTGEELLTTDSQTSSVSTSCSGDAPDSSPAGGLWTTETMATVVPIVTDSLWEQVITAGLLILFWLYVNFTNGTLFHVIRKDCSLHTPQFMILGSYMACDVLYCNLISLQMVPVVISNDILVMPDIVSRILVTVIASFLFSTYHMVGVLAYERYCYFVTPMKYPSKFTKSRIYAAVIVIFVFALCVAFAVELVTPRVPVATFMTYQLATGVSTRLSNYMYLIFYILPSGVVSIGTLIKLRLLISKHSARMEPQSDVMNENHSAVAEIIVKPIQKALKMIALVSGSFWLTVVPGLVIRAGLTGSGVTWADTDQRVSLPMFALARTSYLMVTVLSSALNPIIYMTVLTELREAVYKCIGIKRNNSVTHN